MSTEPKEKSDSETVTFTAPFDFTWPSRAMTHYAAGWSGRVKAEVVAAARKAGVIAPVDAKPVTK